MFLPTLNPLLKSLMLAPVLWYISFIVLDQTKGQTKGRFSVLYSKDLIDRQSG